MTPKSLEQVHAEAEAYWKKNKEERPETFPDHAKNSWLLGWLEQSYRTLYEQCKTKGGSHA